MRNQFSVNARLSYLLFAYTCVFSAERLFLPNYRADYGMCGGKKEKEMPLSHKTTGSQYVSPVLV